MEGQTLERRGCLLYHPSPLPSGQAHPTYQEGPKHSNGGQEVPDVVVIKEVKEDAVSVVLPGLCGGFLAGNRVSSLLSLLCRTGSTPTNNPVPGTIPGQESVWFGLALALCS